MRGYIFTFGEDMSPSEMVKRHNSFFGRVAKVRRGGQTHYYYYPGILHDISFYKLANGCYFIPLQYGRILSPGKGPIEAELDIKDLKTAKEYFLEKYIGIKVNNLE